MEIVVNLRCGKDKHMKKIAEETEIPYTTVQKRVKDMEEAGIVVTWNEIDRRSGKSVKMVHVKEFNHTLSPLAIKDYLEAKE
jgi:DNA-binding Lrp family transcriptional regulator